MFQAGIAPFSEIEKPKKGNQRGETQEGNQKRVINEGNQRRETKEKILKKETKGGKSKKEKPRRGTGRQRELKRGSDESGGMESR